MHIMSASLTSGDYVALTDVQRTIYSREMRFQALPVMKFFQFAIKKSELLAPGKSARFLKYNNLTSGSKITNEAADIPNSPLSTTYVDITVDEYGNSVFINEMLIKASFDDVLASTAKLLGRDYAKVLDEALRDIVLAGSNVVYGNGKATLGSLISTDAFNTTAVKDAVEVLASNNTPKINNDFYVCFLTPHQARCLRDDPNWIRAQTYAYSGAQTSPLILGEIGRYEDVRFVETTQMTVDTSSVFDIHKAVIFGDDAYAYAEGLPVELREQTNDSFGRKHGLAWYTIFGAGILNDENIVRIETA